MKKHNSAGQHGTGLIETLMIVLFVSIGIVALFKFQHYLSYSTNLTHQQSDATILAVSKIESLRDFQVIPTTSGYTAYNDIASGTSTSTVGNTTYTLTWTVTSNATPAYKTIDITVSWTDRYATSQSIRLVTQVAGVDPANSALVI